MPRRRNDPPIDVEPYKAIMAEALRAYELDVQYSVAMMIRAHDIHNRKQINAERKTYRDMGIEYPPDLESHLANPRPRCNACVQREISRLLMHDTITTVESRS